jgi:hypothetical protein
VDIFLDQFFIVFHTLLALFILFGWMWKKSRKINLLILFFTIFSWTILGFWFGFGYCPLTDWHWHIRYRLGFYDMPNSYIKFLADTLTGIDWNETVIDVGTGIAFSLSFMTSLTLNIFDQMRKTKDKVV